MENTTEVTGENNLEIMLYLFIISFVLLRLLVDTAITILSVVMAISGLLIVL